MLDKFLIRVNEEDFNYKFFTPKSLKSSIQSVAINGFTLYNDQSKFFRNISEVTNCRYLSYALGETNDGSPIFERKQRLSYLAMPTDIMGLEALTKFKNLLNLGNSMLESVMVQDNFSHFGIDFIPQDFIQSEKKKHQRKLIEVVNNPNSIDSIEIPEQYKGIPKVLIPEIVFYHKNLINDKLKQ